MSMRFNKRSNPVKRDEPRKTHAGQAIQSSQASWTNPAKSHAWQSDFSAIT